MLEEIVRAILKHASGPTDGLCQVATVRQISERHWHCTGTCFRRSIAFKREWDVTRYSFDYIVKDILQ